MNVRDWYAALPRRGWQRHALCQGLDQSAFFTRHPESAKRICARCPVSDDCLVDALRCEPVMLDARAGVFGGMCAAERQHFARTLEAHGIACGDRWFARIDRDMAA